MGEGVELPQMLQSLGVTRAETDIIIEYMTELGNRGFPLSHHRLKEHVQEMLWA
jgi:hypothetical protein